MAEVARVAGGPVGAEAGSCSQVHPSSGQAPPHPGGGSRPSAAAPRGLPGCGEAELSQENGPIKSFELIKHASDIQEPSKAFETATVLVAVVEHLSERQRVMRSNR